MIQKILLTATLVLSLAACSFKDDNSSAQSQRVAKQNQKLKAIFDSISGKYVGQITASTGPQDIEIDLFPLSVPDPTGNNPDGTPRYNYILAASYKRINPVGATFAGLSASYIPETGDLTLLNPNKSPNTDDVNTVIAKVSGTQLIGQANSSAGVIGVFTLSLSSHQSDVPSNNDQDDYNNRLRAQYQAISGTYHSDFAPQDGSTPYPVTLKLYVAEVSPNGVPNGTVGTMPNTNGSAAGNTVPQLWGIYSRDDDASGFTMLNLTSVYRADLNPPRLTLNGKPRAATTTGYQAIFDGTLKDNVYTGNKSSNVLGAEGTFTFLKATR